MLRVTAEIDDGLGRAEEAVHAFEQRVQGDDDEQHRDEEAEDLGAAARRDAHVRRAVGGERRGVTVRMLGLVAGLREWRRVR